MILSYDSLVKAAAARGFIFAWNAQEFYVWTNTGETVFMADSTLKIANWFKLYDIVSGLPVK